MDKLRTLWPHPERENCIQVIDQRALPHQMIIRDLASSEEVFWAIRDMVVRGAPLIGATAAYGMYFAGLEAQNEVNPLAKLLEISQRLAQSRPTAVNLFWAINRQLEIYRREGLDWQSRCQMAQKMAGQLVEEDVETCRLIGEHGLKVFQKVQAQKASNTLQILTHCNAGMLGCIEWGTATSPMYLAHQAGMDIHVWVDETRPRNQGANLTAWELGRAGIPHTIIVDNAGGHLMQHGQVDLVIVGTDRTTRTGDVANKIGTYLKALAAFDNQVPFYVALPSTTIDWGLRDGVREIPIEERDPKEVHSIRGWDGEKIQEVRISPESSRAANFGFDVTPARLVSGLITERGTCLASEEGLLDLFPEKREGIKI